MTYLLANDLPPNRGMRRAELDENDLEWILNSLRLMQEHQQRLASENRGKKLSKGDVLRTTGAGGDKDYVLDKDAPEVDLAEDMFLPQFNEVTDLRERLVAFIGRDLTDG